MTPTEIIDHHFETLAASHRSKALPLRPLRLLIVDDNENDRDLMRRMVRPLGHELVESKSCEGALNALAIAGVNGFDLVFLDIQMPLVDGIECLSRLKEIAPDLPVVFLTGAQDVARLQDVLKSGYLAMMTKQFDNTILTDLLKKYTMI